MAHKEEILKVKEQVFEKRKIAFEGRGFNLKNDCRQRTGYIDVDDGCWRQV